MSLSEQSDNIWFDDMLRQLTEVRISDSSYFDDNITQFIFLWYLIFSGFSGLNCENIESTKTTSMEDVSTGVLEKKNEEY